MSLSLSLPLPKAVFFDWDGTLVDSLGFLHEAHNYTRSQFGMAPFSLEVFAGYFGQPREKLYAEIYGVENIEAAKGHFESFVYKNHKSRLKPMTGAHDVLEGFQALDIPMGVVTNKKADLVTAEIAHYGWGHYFDAIVGAGEAEADKPSAAPLLLAIDRAGLKLPMGDIWFVGDTDNDLECAAAAGVKSILVVPAAEAAPLLENYKVDLHCNNCSEMFELLLQNMPEGLKQRQ